MYTKNENESSSNHTVNEFTEPYNMEAVLFTKNIFTNRYVDIIKVNCFIRISCREK